MKKIPKSGGNAFRLRSMLISTALNAQQRRGLGFDRAQPPSVTETSGLGFDRAQLPSGAETHTTVKLSLEIA